jgi:hypothetical protein
MDFKRLLGRDRDLSTRDARRCLDVLIELWNQQATLTKSAAHTRGSLAEFDCLAGDLKKLHYWFNPTATGRRLRDALEQLPAVGPNVGNELADLGDLVEVVDDRRALVSPEGRVGMWVIAAALRERPDADVDDDPLWLPQHQVSTAWSSLNAVYQDWNRQRLRDVTGLLREETATLRPSVIALLLVLLMNRNTAKERRLPAPTKADLSRDVSRAVAEPALAFAQALGGSRDSQADARGLEVYRGWAIGEIARRLGTSLHREDGIWIDESAVPAAEDRLIAALINRPPKQLVAVPHALDALIEEYDRVRPVLTTLGIAHERPSVTKRLVEKIVRAVEEKMAANGTADAEAEP